MIISQEVNIFMTRVVFSKAYPEPTIPNAPRFLLSLYGIIYVTWYTSNLPEATGVRLQGCLTATPCLVLVSVEKLHLGARRIEYITGVTSLGVLKREVKVV